MKAAQVYAGAGAGAALDGAGPVCRDGAGPALDGAAAGGAGGAARAS